MTDFDKFLRNMKIEDEEFKREMAESRRKHKYTMAEIHYKHTKLRRFMKWSDNFLFFGVSLLFYVVLTSFFGLFSLFGLGFYTILSIASTLYFAIREDREYRKKIAHAEAEMLLYSENELI